MKTKLPNFLIVGAAKSGTTSLHNYLNQHPDIFMPTLNAKGIKIKEPQFLVRNLVKKRLHHGVWTWEEYKSLFEGAGNYKLVGESSVFYLYYYQEAIQEIKNRLGSKVKIIIMLRNPINRAYSAYQHVSRGLTEQLTFEKALQIEEERLDQDKFLTPMVMYKDMGMYYKMVKAYLESFDNVHIILYKDFSNDTEEEIKKVFCFLGVNESKKVDFTTRYNVGGRRWKNRIIKKIFTKEYKLKLALKSKLPRQLRKEIRGKLVRPFTKNVLPMKKKTRGYLKEYFREDVKRLTILINKNLTNWIK